VVVLAQVLVFIEESVSTAVDKANSQVQAAHGTAGADKEREKLIASGLAEPGSSSERLRSVCGCRFVSAQGTYWTSRHQKACRGRLTEVARG
jgi:hypothetical protein